MDGTQPAAADSVEPVPPERLRERFASGDDPFVLDVRSAREYETWHVDGPNAEVLNYPHPELRDAPPDDLLADLPADRPATVVSARGGESEELGPNDCVDDGGAR